MLHPDIRALRAHLSAAYAMCDACGQYLHAWRLVDPTFPASSAMLPAVQALKTAQELAEAIARNQQDQLASPSGIAPRELEATAKNIGAHRDAFMQALRMQRAVSVWCLEIGDLDEAREAHLRSIEAATAGLATLPPITPSDLS